MIGWGIVIGGVFGYLLGGFFGALLGALLGRSFDKGLNGLPNGFTAGNRARIQETFFAATFSVMGRVAKADGQVSQAEIRLAEQVMAQMALDGSMRQQAVEHFAQGKEEDFPLQEVVQGLRASCHGNSRLLLMFLEIQLRAAYADGDLDHGEDQLLRQICTWLGISELDYRRLERMIQAEGRFSAGTQQQAGATLEEAYALLGVSADTSDAEVKKAYRRLLSQHHPDKLVSKGLPEAMMKMAAQKTHEIKQAYEQIKQAREALQ